ncbi:hypothetical protein [Caballeronia sp. ATUFL_M1_KS5A]|uniref:hypothetical protein n=1 Tax=Caballeronia sp. ATUFL_M1_KS5A TaxID=2921778 RepID=UPI002028053F|nr:hypothetical protein [Caballeronia sp. ATUFL_M1_KS5A]
MRPASQVKFIPGIGREYDSGLVNDSDSTLDGYVCRAVCDLNSTRYKWEPATFTTSFEVPPPPNSARGQAVFLFPGMQGLSNEKDEKSRVKTILQPVLEWNNDELCEWRVRSWVVKGTREAGLNISARTIAHTVKPGDHLTAYITYWGANDARHRYSCGFDNIDSVNLDVSTDFTLNEVGVALEVAHIFKNNIISQLPTTKEIGFYDTHFSLDQTNTNIDFNWKIVYGLPAGRTTMVADSQESVVIKLES